MTAHAGSRGVSQSACGCRGHQRGLPAPSSALSATTVGPGLTLSRLGWGAGAGQGSLALCLCRANSWTVVAEQLGARPAWLCSSSRPGARLRGGGQGVLHSCVPTWGCAGPSPVSLPPEDGGAVRPRVCFKGCAVCLSQPGTLGQRPPSGRAQARSAGPVQPVVGKAHGPCLRPPQPVLPRPMV